MAANVSPACCALGPALLLSSTGTRSLYKPTPLVTVRGVIGPSEVQRLTKHTIS